MENKKYIDERTVANLTGFALSTLRNSRFHGVGIPYYKIGRSVRYCLDDVLQYMEEHKVSVAKTIDRSEMI